MNYDDALHYIHGTSKFGSKLGLTNITNLLDLMGNIHKKLNYIHVAGTNGKGSTTAMIASILKQSAYKVGMYTSPYIEEFTERIQINNQNIDKEKLAIIISQIKDNIKEMLKSGYNHPTEFEIITAAAFQYFYDEKCDYVVLEVGMGGRFDATNVIPPPLVSVITSISIDHIAHLGNNVSQIAFEKCGIIKNNVPVVTYPYQDKEALEVIRDISKQKSAKLLIPTLLEFDVLSDTLYGTIFNYNGYKEIEIQLLGIHQVYNAILAISTANLLKDYYKLDISEGAIKRGIKETRWPGRLEILSYNPMFIIDGGHNLSGIQVLSKALNRYFKKEKKIIIIGMLKDKAYEKCIEIIAQDAESIIATEPDNNRALDANIIKDIAQAYCNHIIVQKDIRKAVEQALNISKGQEVICCCGSLYLIGSVRGIFNNEFIKDVD